MDVVVAYRIYPKVSKDPILFKEDKLALAELGVRSFKNALGSLNVKCYFILDNCPNEYEDMILRYFDKSQVEFVRCDGVGNKSTFGLQMNILLQQDYSEYIFFVEDDYIFRKDTIQSALDFLRRKHVCFVTLYDHIDNYTLGIHQQYKYKIILHQDHHWRTTASTCMTFLTKKSVLRNTESVFRSYCRGNWDSSLWFALTKHNVFNWRSLKLYFTDKTLFKAFVLSWIKTGVYVLFGRKYDLWQPIPSYATHMENTGLAPVIDWIGVANEESS